MGITTYYTVRCPHCGLAVLRTSKAEKIPFDTTYTCYGCDKEFVIAEDTVEADIGRESPYASIIWN